MITSKNTSVNTTKIPAIYNKINFEKILQCYPQGGLIVDYGCGRKIEHIRKFVASKSFEYAPYDPYWLPSVQLENIEGLMKDYYFEDKPVIVICTNVLNVIPDWDVVKEVHQWIAFYNYITHYFISIYEGDKSRIGKVTKKDCWQWNKPIYDYQWHFEDIKKRIIYPNGQDSTLIK